MPRKKSGCIRPEVKTSHGQRMALEAAALDRDSKALWELYKQLDGILTRRPLKPLRGPTEHYQYATLVRDISLRAWREVESVSAIGETHKKVSLTILQGGKS